ncbi:MAG TPA: 6-phosphofructokinase [Rhodospirillales bacterium]|jgi:6-phosphofructokinase 1|nr:MAG: Pyrophosphate--fructose 6-phosphate 1-phosphotransferase [Alphaproteobacteria bacterium MarineAlpha3_Bin2]HIC29441.1 6-phosphofructokinase [Rhodospirillales bacterium]HIM25616.1 6-phosphofructokinase [Rhodospirillales bacterium]HIM77054.1 6-phosphofructokinase [Rhodospirillales bacterium]
MSKTNILIAQGGGPTAVINESLVGAVLESRGFDGTGAVYGAFNGVSGIVNEDFINLSLETAENLENVAKTPCSALGSTRDKPDQQYCQDIFKVLKAHDIGTFFYIGGNDSSDTLRILAEEAVGADYPLRCIHIPKTIDNDLTVNDHTPGYPSAAKFVASAFAGVNLDNRALLGVYVGVVMGRHAGFLTAASALGRKYDDDGPHLIYLPERNFSMDSFINDVQATSDKYGRCVIAVSEGIHDDSGAPIVTKLAKEVEKDAHGNVQLSGTGALADLLCDAIRERTGQKRVRGDTFGYLQRSFLGCVSDVDQRESRAVGVEAARFAHEGDKDGTVTIHRNGSGDNYAAEYQLSKLEDVAGKTKVMADDLIDPSGHDISPAFVDYLKPLLGSDMPEPHRLEADRVAKILKG